MGTSILGIDEHTSLIINLAEQSCRVIGKDAVHIYCDGGECSYRQGEVFTISALGDYHPLKEPGDGISAAAWQAATAAEKHRADAVSNAQVVPTEVERLVAERQAARMQRNWAEADRLRAQILAFGWNVKDTPEGSTIEPIQ